MAITVQQVHGDHFVLVKQGRLFIRFEPASKPCLHCENALSPNTFIPSNVNGHESDKNPVIDADDERAWPVMVLRNIASKIGSGSTPRGGESVYVQSGVPFIRSMNVHFDGLRAEGLAYIDTSEAEKLSNVTVQADDVLLNITGASIGRVTTAPKDIAGARVNQHVCIIRPKANLLPKFLAYFFASPSEQSRILKVQVGATRQALTKLMIENWLVPVPAIEEQERIVAEIEKQFTRLQVGMSLLTRVQCSLKRYHASVLKAACEGRLAPTEAELARRESRSYEHANTFLTRIRSDYDVRWKGRSQYKMFVPVDASDLPHLPEGWTWATIEQLSSPELNSITDGPFGSNLKTEHYTTQGPRVIRLQNIGDGKYVDAIAHISEAHFERLKKHRVFAGDLVIATFGENPPRSCIIPDAVGPAIVKADCIRFKPHHQLSAVYLNAALNSELVRKRTKGMVHGVGRPRLNLRDIKSIVLPIPPLIEQRRLSAELQRHLSVIDAMKASVAANIRRASRLRQSILSHTFKSASLEGLTSTVASTKDPWIPQVVKQRTQQDLKIEIMSRNVIQTAADLLALVKRQKSGITPEKLCYASGFDEEVELFFDLGDYPLTSNGDWLKVWTCEPNGSKYESKSSGTRKPCSMRSIRPMTPALIKSSAAALTVRLSVRSASGKIRSIRFRTGSSTLASVAIKSALPLARSSTNPRLRSRRGSLSCS